jgi:hypothetical protein
MKSINKSLLVAAVLSTALTALAQNPGGQNPGAGGTSPDPTNETNTTNASGARTEGDTSGRTGGVGATNTRGANTDGTTRGTGTNPSSVKDANREHSAQDDMNQPKKKRSFWDRLTGRNKQLDANQTTPDRTNETDSSGRRIETQP